jgi:hypothetical protein
MMNAISVMGLFQRPSSLKSGTPMRKLGWELIHDMARYYKTLTIVPTIPPESLDLNACKFATFALFSPGVLVVVVH